MASYRGYIYLAGSIGVLILSSFFSQQIVDLLMSLIEPLLNGKAAILAPGEMARYNAIIVYGGLGISGALFLSAIKLLLGRLLSKGAAAYGYLQLAILLLTFSWVFLFAVKVSRLFRGDVSGLFPLPLDTAIVMITLMVLIACDFFRRRKKETSIEEQA